MEENIINKLATYWASITGITTAPGFAQNPDNIPAGMLPLVITYPMQADYEQAAHYNVWKNLVRIRSSLYVVPRMSKGGKLKFVENAALGFPQLIRQKFQSATVINDFLSLGLQKAFLKTIVYGAGGMYLTHNDIEYVGFIVDFDFQWTAGGPS